MDDYISREDAKIAVVDVAQSRENGFQWGEAVTFTPSKIIGLINKIPAADVKPVVRGKWGDNGIPGSMLCGCSECGFTCGARSFNYCPNCGADMREETEK